jgi:HlyD family secretion protein/Putative peptidoglycan binding domain
MNGMPDVRRRHRRWAQWAVVAAVALAAAAAAVMVIAKPFASHKPPNFVVAGNAGQTSLYTVARDDLSSQTQVSATLGYAGSYTVVNQAQGTVTGLPMVGQVVSQGQVLYRVDGAPVVLLDGNTPAYRSLSQGAYASEMTGADVAELNADLVALGYATRAEIPAGSDQFTWWTTDAVEKLQKALGVTETGTLALGQAVFLPSAARVETASATPGGSAQPGQPVLTATSTARQVSIALDADEQSEVSVGDKVTITLPNNQTTPGVISSVGAVATAQPGGSSTITVEVTPTDSTATGTWDQAPVDVAITTGSVSNALVVPVDALLAQSSGGYAVEVASTGGIRRLVPVSLGLFDDADGLVQVTRTSLAAGQQIVVPNL